MCSRATSEVVPDQRCKGGLKEWQVPITWAILLNSKGAIPSLRPNQTVSNVSRLAITTRTHTLPEIIQRLELVRVKQQAEHASSSNLRSSLCAILKLVLRRLVPQPMTTATVDSKSTTCLAMALPSPVCRSKNSSNLRIRKELFELFSNHGLRSLYILAKLYSAFL